MLATEWKALLSNNTTGMSLDPIDALQLLLDETLLDFVNGVDNMEQGNILDYVRSLEGSNSPRAMVAGGESRSTLLCLLEWRRVQS